jgi:hypothetical protein
MSEPAFELWFSYPCEVTPSGMIGPDEDVFILRIELASGDMYELTVWTDAYLTRRRQDDRESGDRLSGQYLPLPDLVVADKDVTLIEQIIADLIQTQQLRPEWIIPDEFTVSYDDFDPAPAEAEDPDDAWVAMPESVAIDVGWSGCHGRPAA